MTSDAYDPHEDPDAPPRYEVDGKVYYRASGFGGCDRMMVAMAQGYEARQPSEFMQEVFAEGHAAEPQIIEHIEAAYDVVVADTQRRVELELLEDVYVAGHVDGLTYSGVDGVLVECKKFRDSTWEGFKRRGVEVHKNYPWQVSAYMHGLEVQECWFVGGHWNDKTQEVDEIYRHVLQAPPLPLKALKMRAAKLEALIASNPIITDVKCEASYPCPVFYLHDDPNEATELVTDDVLTLLMDEYQKLNDRPYQAMREMIAKKEKRLKELKVGIQGWLDHMQVADNQPVQVRLKDGSVADMKWHKVVKPAHPVKKSEFFQVTVNIDRAKASKGDDDE